MLNKNKYYVFDFDGTIAINGQITKENLKILNKIENKVLNTSRSWYDLPNQAKKVFNKIMVLNGSLYYENSKIVDSFKVIDLKETNKLIKIAKENNLNISFNSTQVWQNVSTESSQDFISKRGLKFYENINQIPKDIYLIAISSSNSLKESLFEKIKVKNIFKQSERMFEFTNNSKANIIYRFTDYIAFGDNKNDLPMMEVAKKAIWVKGTDLASALIEINNK